MAGPNSFRELRSYGKPGARDILQIRPVAFTVGAAALPLPFGCFLELSAFLPDELLGFDLLLGLRPQEYRERHRQADDEYFRKIQADSGAAEVLKVWVRASPILPQPNGQHAINGRHTGGAPSDAGGPPALGKNGYGTEDDHAYREQGDEYAGGQRHFLILRCLSPEQYVEAAHALAVWKKLYTREKDDEYERYEKRTPDLHASCPERIGLPGLQFRLFQSGANLLDRIFPIVFVTQGSCRHFLLTVLIDLTNDGCCLYSASDRMVGRPSPTPTGSVVGTIPAS